MFEVQLGRSELARAADSRRTIAAMRDMEPMTLAEIETAPFRVRQTARLDASPDGLFAQLIDPQSWTRWFPLMYRAAWTSPETAGVGAEREVALRVFGGYRERMLAWDPGERFAFTMTASTSPLVRRMAEDYRLHREGSGVRLEWTVGAYPSTIGKLGAPALRLVLSRLFAGAGANLQTLLRRPTSNTTTSNITT